MPYTDVITEDIFQFLMRVKNIIENYEVNVLHNKFEAYDERNEDNWLVIKATWPEDIKRPKIQFPIAYFEPNMTDQETLQTYLQLSDPKQTLLL